MITNIDVHDLPEEAAEAMRKLADLLRQKIEAERLDNRTAEPEAGKIEFEKGPLGVKGTLSREEIYDYL